MSAPLNQLGIEEDFQAWEAYKHVDKYRLLFNKMEVALMQGLDAGPAAVPPKHPGIYIHRPIYNLYGMGIGATKFSYDPDNDYDAFINHATVPPGHFWCEWVVGEHRSIDYQQYSDGTWKTRSITVGKHKDDSNLTKFDHWIKMPNKYAPTFEETGLYKIIGNDPYVAYCNIEMRGHFIVEVHLRLGNDPFDDLPVGAKIIPVWNNEEAPPGEWMGNLHADMEQYKASGYLSDVRRGYVIQYPA